MRPADISLQTRANACSTQHLLMTEPQFPDGKSFAFTIIDDTDCATVANVRPVYELLNRLGMRTTKTIWPLPGHHPQDPCDPAQPVTDPDYIAFLRELQGWGFEIALHNVRSYSSKRHEIAEGLRSFQRIVGHAPRVHANHMFNQDGLYWREARMDSALLRWAYGLQCRRRGLPPAEGHEKNSPYFWGDFCEQQIEYVRGFTFPEINALKMNPTLPYRDPRRPYVKYWFSGSDAANVEEFKWLIRHENQEQLERENGICIVATHLASGFVKDGKVEPKVEALLTEMAGRPGWFVPVSELLDFLVTKKGGQQLPWLERHRMQWRWMFSRLSRSAG